MLSSRHVAFSFSVRCATFVRPPNPQTRLVPGPERIRQSLITPKPLTIDDCGPLRTIRDCLLMGKEKSKDGAMVGDIVGDRVEYNTYGQVLEDAECIMSGMIAHGFVPGQNSNVGLAGINSRRYATVNQSIHLSTSVCVPVYSLAKPDDLGFIINHTEMKWMFCDTAERAKTFVDAKQKGIVKSLERIIVLNGGGEGELQSTQDLQILHYDDLLRVGREKRVQLPQGKTTDVFLIEHTSGTTGRPKGVIVRHCNMIPSCVSFTLSSAPPGREGKSLALAPNDIYFSYLPYAHIYEVTMEKAVWTGGACMVPFRGDVKTLLDDIRVVRPTAMAMVPRVLNRVYDSIHEQIAHGPLVKRILFNLAKEYKVNLLRKGELRYDTIADKLVFHKVAALFGGRLKFMITGGAALAPHVKDFVRIAFGAPVFEGYGQTEQCAVAILTYSGETQNTNIGVPVAWCEMKLADVPHMGYYSKEDRGEVCMRGAAVTCGYYKDEAKTKETIDEDGWLHSGDIGEWLPDGSLRLIDRKQAFFKLAQGEFVSAEQVELTYSNHPFVTQVCVVGDVTRSFLVGIIIPCESQLRKTLQNNTKLKELLSLPWKELIRHPSVRKFVLDELTAFGRTKGLKGYELVHDLRMDHEEFTPEKDLLTASMKLRRKQIQDHYKSEIDEMYAAADYT